MKTHTITIDVYGCHHPRAIGGPPLPYHAPFHLQDVSFLSSLWSQYGKAGEFQVTFANNVSEEFSTALSSSVP
jgi:hypothetical protein